MNSVFRSKVIFLSLLMALSTGGCRPRENVLIFKADWESLRQYRCPEWFRDAKFGIFVTWGVYSVPGQGCWYGRNMYEE